MREEDYAQLLEHLEQEVLKGASSIGILGTTRITLQLIRLLASAGLSANVKAIYSSTHESLAIPVRPFSALQDEKHDVLIVADDEGKEELLFEALPFINGLPKILVGGYGHLAFRDSMFHQELSSLLVPSL